MQGMPMGGMQGMRPMMAGAIPPGAQPPGNPMMMPPGNPMIPPSVPQQQQQAQSTGPVQGNPLQLDPFGAL